AAPLPLPSDAQSAACGQSAGAPRAYTSADDLASLLAGSWLLCSGNGITSHAVAAQIGIEIDCDHHFYLLHADGNGNVARGTSVDDTGTWTIRNTSAFAPPIFDLILDFNSGFETWISPEFESNPSFMRLDSAGGVTSVYVPLPMPTGAAACALPDGPLHP